MGWREFVAEMFRAAVWPAVAIVTVLIFRRQVKELLGHGLRRVKAGPVEAEWNHQVLEAKAAVKVQAIEEASEGIVGPPVGSALISRLRGLVPETPDLAVIAGFKLIEAEIERLAMSAGAPLILSTEMYVDHLSEWGMLSTVAAQAIKSLRRLRNIASHPGMEEISPAKADEYLSLVESVLELLVRERLVREKLAESDLPLA
jgi:hypothetical protein